MPSEQALQKLAQDKPVIAFARNTRYFYFIPEGGLAEKQITENDLAHHIVRINALEADATGAILRTDENSSYLYYLVKILCLDYKKPNHFSPEYVFAQEFTLHYNEFANSLPEFARLRELARLTVYVQLLNGVKKSQEAKKSHLEGILNNSQHWHIRQHETDQSITKINQEYQRIYDETYREVQATITQDMNKFNSEYSRTALDRKHRAALSEMMQDIGTLDFTIYSPEVIAHCEEMFQENRRRILNQYGQKQWDYNASDIRRQCNNEKETIAKDMTRQKREAIHKQLFSHFDALLPDPRITISEFVTQFMDGYPGNLVGLLVNNSYNKSLTTFADSLSSLGVTKSEVEQALSSSTARNNIATTITDKNTQNLRTQRYTAIERAKCIPEEEKTHLRQLIAKISNVIDQLFALGIGREQPSPTLPIPSHKCTWVPASVDHQEGRTRLVYGGVHIQPRINIETRMTAQTQSAVNTCYNPDYHYRYNAQDLPRATQDGRSNAYHHRMAAHASSSTPSASAGAPSGGSGSSRGGGSFSGGSSSGSGSYSGGSSSGGSSSGGGGGSSGGGASYSSRIPVVTEKGLRRVEEHLNRVFVHENGQNIPKCYQNEFQGPERAMLQRLHEGHRSSQDVEFYLHELKESSIFRRTMNLKTAHEGALKYRNATEFNLFHKDVMDRYPDQFNATWRKQYESSSFAPK